MDADGEAKEGRQVDGESVATAVLGIHFRPGFQRLYAGNGTKRATLLHAAVDTIATACGELSALPDEVSRATLAGMFQRTRGCMWHLLHARVHADATAATLTFQQHPATVGYGVHSLMDSLWAMLPGQLTIAVAIQPPVASTQGDAKASRNQDERACFRRTHPGAGRTRATAGAASHTTATSHVQEAEAPPKRRSRRLRHLPPEIRP